MLLLNQKIMKLIILYMLETTIIGIAMTIEFKYKLRHSWFQDGNLYSSPRENDSNHGDPGYMYGDEWVMVTVTTKQMMNDSVGILLAGINSTLL